MRLLGVYAISTYSVSHKRVFLGLVFVYYYIIIRESGAYYYESTE